MRNVRISFQRIEKQQLLRAYPGKLNWIILNVLVNVQYLMRAKRKNYKSTEMLREPKHYMILLIKLWLSAMN